MKPTNAYLESFNARHLGPEEVAENFVAPSYFKTLLGNYHAILVGPRGSGKTTLLKMLQQRALENWKGPAAKRARANINYTGVFIPADISWGLQVASLGNGKLSVSDHKALSVATFAAHVLRALVSAMIDRTGEMEAKGVEGFRRVLLSQSAEVNLVKNLSSAWRLSPDIPTLLSLQQALRLRLSHIRQVANDLIRTERRLANLGQEVQFVDLDFLSCADYAIDLFDAAVGDMSGRWAFLFDELEIAPEWIQEHLLTMLRSGNPKILLKLAISPYSPHGNKILSGIGAAAGHDLREIPLWATDRKDSLKFCRLLWRSISRDLVSPDLSADEVLGASYFDPPAFTDNLAPTIVGERLTPNRYSENSIWASRFASLANIDKTFDAFLKHKRINVNDLDSSDRSTHGPLIRKMAPFVAVREYFRKDPSLGTARVRSRKSSEIYSGADSYFLISEGNPRWLIGMTQSLLAKQDLPIASITARDQANEIDAAAERFRAMLATIPLTPTNHPLLKDGLIGLLDTIGEAFFKKVVIDEFQAEPPSTFVVDSDIDSAIEHALQAALNVGAVVYIPDNSSKFLVSSMRGRRFRLSYMLSPVYRLPLRSSRSISLSKLLYETRQIKVDQRLPFVEDQV
jgi:energy-coupling factor transporter ATP-binding protein EcfA2